MAAAVAVVLVAALLVGLLGLLPSGDGASTATPPPAPIVFPTSVSRN